MYGFKTSVDKFCPGKLQHIPGDLLSGGRSRNSERNIACCSQVWRIYRSLVIDDHSIT